MDIRKINDQISVSPQLAPSQMDAIAKAGFKSIIINRPDGEGPGQPTSQEITAAAEAAGLKTAYIPVVSGQLTQNNVTDFAKAMDDLPLPVLAYCRSGTRSATLWSLTQAARGTPMAEILSATAAAGYDMSFLASQARG